MKASESHGRGRGLVGSGKSGARASVHTVAGVGVGWGTDSSEAELVDFLFLFSVRTSAQYFSSSVPLLSSSPPTSASGQKVYFDFTALKSFIRLVQSSPTCYSTLSRRQGVLPD